MIVDQLEGLITTKTMIKDKLMMIKSNIENRQFIEARNRIEEILPYCEELYSVLLFVLNNLGEYDVVIGKEADGINSSISCVYEYAKAYYSKGEYEKSQKYLGKLEKDFWNEWVYFLSGSNHKAMGEKDIAQKEFINCISKNKKFVDAYISLAELIYEKDVELATDYLDIALSIEPECEQAYWIMAQISKKYDDFNRVVDYYEKYIKYSGEDSNDMLQLDLAINMFHAKKTGWQIAFRNWNSIFRKNKNVIGEQKVPVIDIGINYFCFFVLHSTEKGINVSYNDREILSITNKEGKFRAGIGLFVPGIDFEINKFVKKEEENPLARSKRSIMEETALPAIYKFYDDLKTYEETLSLLIGQGKLHLNHVFAENIKEYMIDAKDISIKLKTNCGDLKGSIFIGDVDMIIDIKLVSSGFEMFVNQLKKECSYNEAAIIIVYDEKNQTQLRFPKSVIDLDVWDR